MNMEPIDRADMALIVEEIASMTPMNGSDFAMGYHTSLMYIKKFLMGKNPFEVIFNGQTMKIEKAQ